MEEMKNFRDMPMKFKASKIRKHQLAEGSMFQSAEIRSLRSEYNNSKSAYSRGQSTRSNKRGQEEIQENDI